MKRQIFPTASKYRRRTRREFGGETVEYIIVILAVVVIGGGLMGFGNQVSGQIGKNRQQHQLMVRQGERRRR